MVWNIPFCAVKLKTKFLFKIGNLIESKDRNQKPISENSWPKYISGQKTVSGKLRKEYKIYLRKYQVFLQKTKITGESSD